MRALRAPARARGRLPGRLAVAAIVLLGFGLRVWQLGDVPFGFHPDEGHNALDALSIADGWRPVFLPGNNGREPLFAYLMAALLAAAGPSIWAARLAAAFAGASFVAAVYVLARRLTGGRPAAGLLAAALAATAFWPVAQSRYALRASLLPVWVALALWAWWRAIEPDRPQPRRVTAWAAASGALVAAAVHTHMAGRLLPLVLVVSAAWAAYRTRRADAVRALAVAGAVALTLALPQLAYFARHPEMASFRAEQVSVLNPDVNGGELAGTLAHQARRLLEAPFVRGDTSWYHNLRDRPVFDPLAAACFALGLAIAALDLGGRSGARRQGAAVLWLATLAVMAAPSWLSVGAPNYVRLTGAWPALFGLAGLGLAVIARSVSRRFGRAAGTGIAAIVLAASAGLAATDYFGRYAARGEVYEAFNGAAVERGRHVAEVHRRATAYVSPALWRQAVIRFLNAGAPPRSIDATAGLVLPPSGAVAYLFEPSEGETAQGLARRWPWLSRVDARDGRGVPSLVTVRADEAAWQRGIALLDASIEAEPVFGDRIALAGADVEPAHGTPVGPGNAITVTLLWRSSGPIAPDLSRFVHVVAADGAAIGQADGPPLAGSYPTTLWRDGELVLETVPVALGPATGAPRAEVLVGWYDWRSGDRLGLPGDADAALPVATLRIR